MYHKLNVARPRSARPGKLKSVNSGMTFSEIKLLNNNFINPPNAEETKVHRDTLRTNQVSGLEFYKKSSSPYK